MTVPGNVTSTSPWKSTVSALTSGSTVNVFVPGPKSGLSTKLTLSAAITGTTPLPEPAGSLTILGPIRSNNHHHSYLLHGHVRHTRRRAALWPFVQAGPGDELSSCRDDHCVVAWGQYTASYVSFALRQALQTAAPSNRAMAGRVPLLRLVDRRRSALMVATPLSRFSNHVSPLTSHCSTNISGTIVSRRTKIAPSWRRNQGSSWSRRTITTCWMPAACA